MAEGRPQPIRLGGMALRNGLLIHGPTHWAAAVRNAAGEIDVASAPKPVLWPRLANRVPLLRGPLRLAEAMAVIPIIRSRLRSARLPFEDRGVITAIVVTLTASSLLRRRLRATALREGLLQAIGVIPALVALQDRDLAAYHGVEHKAIGAYEQGSDDPASAPKEHRRCGSNLIAPMIVLSAGGAVLLERLVPEPGPIARAGVGLGGAGIAVEMFAWSDRHADTALARAFHTPGHEIQRLIATKEPTPEQLEVGIAALAEILRVESAASASESATGN